ncbi:MAG: hypothetical protein WCH77_08520 [Planctomycetota bacterium]
MFPTNQQKRVIGEKSVSSAVDYPRHFLESLMLLKRAIVFSLAAMLLMASSVSPAQAASGLLARLNKPIIPGMSPLPGLPTASPLGLIAPRLSNAVLVFQKGGLSTPAGRLSGIGVLSPRVSPVFAMFSMPPKTPKVGMMYGLTILSPRAAVLVSMLQGARGLTTGLR